MLFTSCSSALADEKSDDENVSKLPEKMSDWEDLPAEKIDPYQIYLWRQDRAEEMRKNIENSRSEISYEEYMELADSRSYYEFYQVSLNIANEEQLKQIQDAKIAGGAYLNIRKLKQIMGIIPEDMPRLSYEKIKEIVAKYTKEYNEEHYGKNSTAYLPEIYDMLDSYCGGPESFKSTGGRFYYGDETHTEAFMVSSVIFYYKKDETGKILYTERLFPHMGDLASDYEVAPFEKFS